MPTSNSVGTLNVELASNTEATVIPDATRDCRRGHTSRGWDLSKAFRNRRPLSKTIGNATSRAKEKGALARPFPAERNR
jgi:hypothetical protein